MKHIAVLNPKGGCGKTTIATHLAVYASTLGLDVALADHDAQHSSHDWMKSRPNRCADIDLVAAYRGDALGRNYDVIIHDMPAGDFATAQLPLDVCSKVVIPLMPSPIDLKAALQLWMSLSEQGWLDNPAVEFGIVANRVKTNTKYLDIFNQFVEKLEIPRVATLRDTQNYIRSMDNGLTLFDLPPGRVVKDLIQWEPLMEWSGFLDFDDDDMQDLLQELSGQTSASAGDMGGSSSPSESELDRALESALLSLSTDQGGKLRDTSKLNDFESSISSSEVGSHARVGASETESASKEFTSWLGEESADAQEFVSLDDYQAEQLEEEMQYADQESFE